MGAKKIWRSEGGGGVRLILDQKTLFKYMGLFCTAVLLASSRVPSMSGTPQWHQGRLRNLSWDSQWLPNRLYHYNILCYICSGLKYILSGGLHLTQWGAINNPSLKRCWEHFEKEVCLFFASRISKRFSRQIWLYLSYLCNEIPP